MANSSGKTKGWIAEHREALLGAGLISSIVGIAVGAGVSLIGGAGWAAFGGIGTFLLIGIGLAYTILSESLQPPTDGEVDDDGFRHGRWLWKGDDGQLLREKNYNHGVKHGLHVSCFENGQKEAEKEYRNGKLHGSWTIWYENGNKAEEDTYRNGRLQGPYLRWYENGQKKQECCYHDEEMPHGEWTTWHENGTKQVEARFEYGTPNGTWTERDSVGRIVCQREFECGIQHGAGRSYFHDFTNPRSTSGNPLLLTAALTLLAWGVIWQVPPFSIAFDVFVVIFVHELGHFVAAKLVGIPIGHFVLGAGPKLWGMHYGQTSYELRLFPIMGHVKPYEFRRQEFENIHDADGTNDSKELPSTESPVPRQSAVEFVSRPKRLAFFLAGVTLNFATVLVVAFAGWMLKHPDSSLIEAVSGMFQAIWAVTPVIGNSKDFLSGLGVLLATGITPGSIGMISLFMVCLNLLPIPPLDGFHVGRILAAMVIRREIPERYLLPLQAAGVCLVLAVITVNSVFFTGRLVTGIGRVIAQWQTPPIIGQPDSFLRVDGSVTISSIEGDRVISSGEGTRFVAVVMKVKGVQTLLTEIYLLISQPSGKDHSPLGVLFSKIRPKSVFSDVERVERVELRHPAGEGPHAIGIDSDGDSYRMYTLEEPYVTLLYEVSIEEEEFELRYDDQLFPLKLNP